MSFDIDKVRADFPILSTQVNGRPLVYLDNGASAQKPRQVIDAITRIYEGEYANVHRGLHFLSNLATDHYERVRAIIARFLNAPREDEVIFTSGATEAINLVSYAWAGFGAAFGPLVICALFWKRTNLPGAISGMAVGGIMVFVWKYLIKPLGGVFGIYELLPAFLMGLITIIVVSLCTKAPSKEITDEFDEVKAMGKAK